MNEINKTDANRDPISGAPGAHPAGVGAGALVGTAIGVTVGALAGPAGMAAGAALGGAVAGGIAGGLAGKAAGEKVDPTVEDNYWKGSYSKAPYFAKGTDYKVYQPAYRYGWESYPRYDGRKFDDVEIELARDWNAHRGDSLLSWEKAKPATRDAWRRVEHITPTHTHHDAR